MSDQLCEAVRSGSGKAVRAALEEGADPNSSDTDSTALCHAAFDGARVIAKVLLAAGADPNLADGRGFFPLAVAASKDQATVIKLLAESGADLEKTGPQGGTALHTAAAEGCAKAVKALLAAGAKGSAIDEHGAPPVHVAALHGHPKVLKLLVETPFDSKDNGGRTALLHALDAMARHRVESWQAQGTMNGKEATFRIEHGELTVEVGGYRHCPPLAAERRIAASNAPAHSRYLACRTGAELLVRVGARFDHSDADGRSVVHHLAALGEGKLLNRLIKAGASLTAVDKHGRTPMHELAGSKRVSVLESKWLQKRGDFASADGAGNHLIHIAATSGCETMVQELFYNHGGKDHVLIANTDGRTPAECAREAGHDAIGAWLDQEAQTARQAQLIPKPWKIDEALACLDAGQHYLRDLPRTSAHVTGCEHVHLLCGEHWVEAFVHTETGQLQDAVARPRAELHAALRDHLSEGSVDIVVLDVDRLPKGATAAMLLVATESVTGLSKLLDSSCWLRTPHSWGLFHHPAKGWLGLSLSGDALSNVSPEDEDRAREEVADETNCIEPIPALLRATVDDSCFRYESTLVRYEAGELVVLQALNDDFMAYAWIGGDHVLLRYEGGVLRDARVAGIARRVSDTLWSAPSFKPPAEGPAIDLIHALRKGDYGALSSAIAEGRLELLGTNDTGNIKITEQEQASADDLRERLEGGSVTLLVFPDPEQGELDDGALIEKLAATSPAGVMDAVARAGVRRSWSFSGGEVSIYGPNLIWFDGSQSVQPLGKLLADGPMLPAPEDVVAELSDAIRAIARAV